MESIRGFSGLAALLALLGAAGCGRCERVETHLDDRCTPSQGFAAGQPLSFEIRRSCADCNLDQLVCEAQVSGSTIALAVSANQCAPKGIGCPAECLARKAVCALPALPAGSYALVFSGTGADDHTLSVSASGVPSCRF